jgi:RNA polymerase sigma factor for flagellar operon FliA
MNKGKVAASRRDSLHGTDDVRTQFRRLRASRDPNLRDALIRHHIALVRTVAGRLALRLPSHLCLEDLEAAGVHGLLAAIESYDPDRDAEFAAYAQSRIRGAILDELRDLDPLPRSVRERARQIDLATATLEQRLLRQPTQEEIAAFLGVPVSTLHQILQTLRGGLVTSLDRTQPGSNQDEAGNGGFEPILRSQAPSPWRQVALKERQALLAAVLDELPDNERTVLSLYYYEQLTMKEIGAVLEVSESRVSQVHRAAVHRVRARLRRRKITRADLDVEGEDALIHRGVSHAVS